MCSKIYILLFFLSGIVATTTAQGVAIINDMDGYTNVRATPTANGDIIYQIQANQVFWFAQEAYYLDSTEWIPIYIQKNKYGLSCGEWTHFSGFIHRSRIQPLRKLPQYQGTDFEFKYITQLFTSQNKIIDNKPNHLLEINGRYPWGANDSLPVTEVIDIQIKIGSIEIGIHEILYSDLYNCKNEFEIYQVSETYFVYQQYDWSYEIVWIVNQCGVQQRLIGEKD